MRGNIHDASCRHTSRCFFKRKVFLTFSNPIFDENGLIGEPVKREKKNRAQKIDGDQRKHSED
jgi:hypothetical protein